jgi:hypothetical protein
MMASQATTLKWPTSADVIIDCLIGVRKCSWTFLISKNEAAKNTQK